jgi:hypothetical protein
MGVQIMETSVVDGGPFTTMKHPSLPNPSLTLNEFHELDRRFSASDFCLTKDFIIDDK